MLLFTSIEKKMVGKQTNFTTVAERNVFASPQKALQHICYKEKKTPLQQKGDKSCLVEIDKFHKITLFQKSL